MIPASRSDSLSYRLLDLARNSLGGLGGALTGSLSGSIYNDIWTGGSFGWTGDVADMPDWRQVLLQPIYHVDGWGDYPLGTFYCRAPQAEHGPEGTGVKVSGQLFDRSLIVAETRILEPVAYPAGTVGVDAVVARLAQLGEVDLDVVASAGKLGASLSWDAGTTELKVCNDILSAVGYWGLHVDIRGRFRVRPYAAPTLRSVDFQFTPGVGATHLPGWSWNKDDWQVPNRLMGIQKVDGTNQPLTSVRVLPDSSPYSHRAIGRWVDTDPVRDIAAENQKSLDAATSRALLDKSSPTGNLSMSHVWQSEIGLGSLVTFPRASAKPFAYNKWDLNLETPSLIVKATLWEVSQ